MQTDGRGLRCLESRNFEVSKLLSKSRKRVVRAGGPGQRRDGPRILRVKKEFEIGVSVSSAFGARGTKATDIRKGEEAAVALAKVERRETWSGMHTMPPWGEQASTGEARFVGSHAGGKDG